MQNTERQKITNYSFKEYLNLEQETQERFQFYRGEVFAMAGETKRHNRISGNLFKLIDDAIEGKNCDVYLGDVKLEFEKHNYYVYPDVLLTCNAEDLKDDRESLIRNPLLVLEVLSESTMSYDINEKKQQYFKIKSLQYYLIISQEQILVELYECQERSWKYQSFQDLTDIIQLEKLNISFSIKEIYRKVDFEEKKEL